MTGQHLTVTERRRLYRLCERRGYRPSVAHRTLIGLWCNKLLPADAYLAKHAMNDLLKRIEGPNR